MGTPVARLETAGHEVRGGQTRGRTTGAGLPGAWRGDQAGGCEAGAGGTPDPRPCSTASKNNKAHTARCWYPRLHFFEPEKEVCVARRDAGHPRAERGKRLAVRVRG